MSNKYCRAEDLLNGYFHHNRTAAMKFLNCDLTSSAITLCRVVPIEAWAYPEAGPVFSCCSSTFRKLHFASSNSSTFENAFKVLTEMASDSPTVGSTLLFTALHVAVEYKVHSGSELKFTSPGREAVDRKI